MNAPTKLAMVLTAIALAGSTAKAVDFEEHGVSIGGAIRANYVYGDYTESGGAEAQRGDNGGNFELDTFRMNLDVERGAWWGKAEYRWYNGYNFLHTGWIGYQGQDAGTFKGGLVRVPFGVGAYGPANSWFFDQHYYVGLSDDMDLGLLWTKAVGALTLDLAYYAAAEWSGVGASDESARYSYDVVPGDSPYGVYEERNQINLRAVYALAGDNLSSDLGLSLQVGQLKADSDAAEDTEAYAAAVHAKSSYGPVTLMLQGTYYDNNPEYTEESGLDDQLIAMGAYDFAWPVASRGFIPAIALSYTWIPETLSWADSITFYNDYSVIIKEGSLDDGTRLNDSAMNVTGMAIANGGWYIYVDYAYANGNYFVGNEGDDYSTIAGVGDFGVNGNDTWNGRFNINFGYYF